MHKGKKKSENRDRRRRQRKWDSVVNEKFEWRGSKQKKKAQQQQLCKGEKRVAKGKRKNSDTLKRYV